MADGGWRPPAGDTLVSPGDPNPYAKWAPPPGDIQVPSSDWETIVPAPSKGGSGDGWETIAPSRYASFMKDQGQSFSLKPFKDAGYSDAAVEGIRRNIMRESKGDPHAIGDNGSSFGLFQLHNTRWDDLKHWSAKQKKAWKDSDTQVAFALDEVQTKYPDLASHLKGTQSADAAEKAWKDIYERPKGTSPSTLERVAMGATDPIVGGGQLVGRMSTLPKSSTQADADIVNKGLIAAGLPPTASLPGQLDEAVKRREQDYQDRRGPDAGTDWARFGGNLAATAPLGALSPMAAGAAYGALQPVTSDDYWTQKAIDTGASAAGGKIASVGGNVLARMISPAASRITNAVVQKARDAGYVLPPSMMPETGGMVTNTLAGWGGKIKTQQSASVKNQQITNKLGAESLGLPSDTTLTDKVFSDVRSQAGKAYDAVETSGVTIKQDEPFIDQLLSVQKPADEAAQAFPNIVKNDEIKGLVDELGNGKDFSARAGIQTIRRLRSDASANLRNSLDPRKVELGYAQRDAANAIEDLIDRNLQRAGKVDLIPNYRAARQMIAKSHDLESATNTATGDVSARKLASLKNRGRPLSGHLDTIADTANAFPKAVQEPARFGGDEAHSGIDFLTSALAIAHGRPEIAGMIFGRPAVRSALLSRPYQNMLAPPTSAAPAASPAFISPQTRNVLAEAVRKFSQYAAPGGAALAQGVVTP
jgi:hypothetical protein